MIDNSHVGRGQHTPKDFHHAVVGVVLERHIHRAHLIPPHHETRVGARGEQERYHLRVARLGGVVQGNGTWRTKELVASSAWRK